MHAIARNEDPAAEHVLEVRLADGRVVEVPPGKARRVPVPFTVDRGRAFPGWDAWTAEHSPPPPAGDPNLPVIAGRS